MGLEEGQSGVETALNLAKLLTDKDMDFKMPDGFPDGELGYVVGTANARPPKVAG